jgi:anti-anti-sigma factor
MNSSARSLPRPSTQTRPLVAWRGLMLDVVQRLGLEKTQLEFSQASLCPSLRITGALDGRAAQALKAQAKHFVALETRAWSIDLSCLTRWDSSGLQALVYALDLSELAGKQLSLLNPPAPFRKTLISAQLHHLFTIVEQDGQQNFA